MVLEAKMRQVAKPPAQKRAEAAARSRADAASTISGNRSLIQTLSQVGRGKTGKIRPKYQREIDKLQAEITSLMAAHPGL